MSRTFVHSPWYLSYMIWLPNELWLSVRRLCRASLFTGITIMTLAGGIGANKAICKVVTLILLRSLPYRESDRLVAVHQNGSRPRHTGFECTAFDVLYISDGASVFLKKLNFGSAREG